MIKGSGIGGQGSGKRKEIEHIMMNELRGVSPTVYDDAVTLPDPPTRAIAF